MALNQSVANLAIDGSNGLGIIVESFMDKILVHYYIARVLLT